MPETSSPAAPVPELAADPPRSTREVGRTVARDVPHDRPRDVVVAVDLGGRALGTGLMTMKGELIDRVQQDIDPSWGASDVFDALGSLVRQMLDRAADHHHANPVVVGVGCAGQVGAQVATVSPVHIPAWREFPLRERLQALTALPVYGDLDARALALAEGWLGAAQGRSNFLGMVVGGGISGGVVLNGQLLDGASGHAGHVGHVVVEPNGRRCTCGSRGCLEAEASGRAIEAITGRSPSQPSYEIMQRTGELVGRAVATVCNVLDVDLAVVGGPIALEFGATFFNSAQSALDQHSRLEFSRGARITPVRLGERGPLVGAGAVGLRGLRRAARNAR